MTTVVSVAQGGTGSNSAALARTALGVPPSAAYDQANTARTQANTAYSQANSAYSDANTRLSASGGTLAGDLIITGNLTVSGNSTTLNAEILTIEDADIVLLSNVASTPALNAGIIVNRGTSTNTFLRWDEVTDKWGWSDDGSTTYKFTSALDAYAQANSAYGAANNRVLKAGDTMTGQLNISSGGLLVTGNVGIGTASPAYVLSTSSSAHGQYSQHRQSSGTGVGQEMYYMFNDSSGAAVNYASIYAELAANTAGSQTGKLALRTVTAGTLSTKLLVDQTGNVGIGATAPQSRLEVNLISGDSSSLMNANSVNDVTLLRAPFGVNPASVSNGQAKWGLRFVGRNDGTYDNGKSAAVYAVSEETAAGYNRSVGLAFHTSGFDASHTERMRIDSPGNLFLGVTPSAWGSGIKVAQVSFGALVSSATNNTLVTSNCYYDGAQWVYLASSSASIYTQSSGLHTWRTAPSGTAGNTVTFSTLMLLDASGNLGIGSAANTSQRLYVSVSTTDSANGAAIDANSYPVSRFMAHSSGGGIRGLEIGAPTGSVASPVYIKVAETSARFAILNNSGTEQFTILNGGNVGIGTTGPGSRLHVQGGGGIIVDSSGSSDNNYLDCRESGTTRFSIYENSDVAYLNSHNTMALRCNQTGGSGGSIRLDGGNVGIGAAPNTFKLEIAGSIGPSANATYDLGSSTRRWSTVYTSDLDLSNGIGDWTIVEGEDDLFIYNNKRNKVYKFKLEEVDPATAVPKKENL